MSNSSIEGKLKGLHERIQNEMLRTRRDAPFSNQGGLDSPRPGSVRRPRPLFRDIPAFPPRSPHAAETENRMREVHKVSGNLTVNGVKYRSNVDDLQHLGELGSGTCGHVVKMLHKSSGAVIAVKQMRRSGNSEETKRILMDLDVVLGSHDCPYIVRCLGCFVTDADVWICMELMASCFDKLLKKLGEPIPEAILGKVTVATVNALSYLKDTHGVIHRDVKPSNILLDERGNVKLCDFGISGRLVDSKAKTRSAGCAAYMAPERIDPPDPTRPDYDIRADVWSLGISLVELATGAFPYRNCQNDFEVLTKVISDDPPQLPDDSNFSPEFKSFVSKCLTKNYRERPKYAKLLEHPFVVQSARSKVSVGDWYASLPLSAHGTPSRGSVTTTSTYAVSRDVDATPPPPQPPRSYVSSEHWTPEQVTPTPSRPYWATAGSSYSGSSNSQPASLEADYSNYSPYPRRRTLEMSSSPPQPPARRLSADHRWKPTSNSGNTSPIVLQRFFHQSQQRRSRADLHSPRHRSLSREHSNGRSPEPPPRTSRHHGLGAQDNRSNGSTDSELASLLDRLNGPTAAALLRNDRLVETRSHSLTRMEHCNGCHQSPNSPRHLTRGEQGWLHSLCGLLKRRLSRGYVKWHHLAGRREPHVHLQHHSWVHTDSWSLPSSPLPPGRPRRARLNSGAPLSSRGHPIKTIYARETTSKTHARETPTIMNRARDAVSRSPAGRDTPVGKDNPDERQTRARDTPARDTIAWISAVISTPARGARGTYLARDAPASATTADVPREWCWAVLGRGPPPAQRPPARRHSRGRRPGRRPRGALAPRDLQRLPHRYYRRRQTNHKAHH